MFKLVRNIILLLNLYVIVQAQPGGSDPSNAGVPSNLETVSEAPNTAGVNREELLQAITGQLTDNDFQRNKNAFQSLPNHFGNIGPLLFDLMTNDNALGEEMTRVSKIITEYIDLEKYRHSLATIFELADRLEFSQKLGPLFARISDIQDPITFQTFGQAVEIITNIFSNEASIDEIRRRITSPN